MFAVIEDGGRQYRVQQGDTVTLDYRVDVEPGAQLTFERVLLANGGGASAIGKPTIEGATVLAEVVNPLQKGPKLEIQKIRRRKNSRRHTGHRQKHMVVRIGEITVPGLEVVESAVVAAPVAVEAPETVETAPEVVAETPEKTEAADE